MVIDFSKIQTVDTSELNINQANAYYALVTSIQEGVEYADAEYEIRCLYHLTTDSEWPPVQLVYDANN